jgi:crotonobetainyl-CoA:carnitine CoA-transferase CaiB-like acyl-CoA transferase
VKLLEGLRGVSLAINAPGPVAAARLRDFGMAFTKVEPPGGDPLQHLGVGWYEELSAGMKIVSLDLKDGAGREALDVLLGDADLLLTSNRPAGLARLGISAEALAQRYPRLCWVGIVGFPPPRENEPGHDVTYQAEYGTIEPPSMPRVLVADMAGAERAAQTALALLLNRERTGKAGYAYAALSDAARDFAVTVRYGVTTTGGLLGGGLPNYRLYPTAEGWLACGALETHFLQRLMRELGIDTPTEEAFAACFLQKKAKEWEDWGRERDLPLAAVAETG